MPGPMGQQKTIHVTHSSTLVSKCPASLAVQQTRGGGMGSKVVSKTNSGVPLRRTASSGWPSPNSFSPSKSVRLPVNSRNNFIDFSKLA